MESLDFLTSKSLLEKSYTVAPSTQSLSTKISNFLLLNSSERFCRNFPGIVQQIEAEVTSLNILENPGNIAERTHLAAAKVKSALEDFNAFMHSPHSHSATFQMLFSAAALADRIKLCKFQNPEIWNTLGDQHKAIINRLAPLTQPPTEQDVVQYFMPAAADLTVDQSVDLGDGRFFSTSKVISGDSAIKFDLKINPELILVKPFSLSQYEEAFLFEKKGPVDKSRLGRLGEIFDLQKWEQCFLSAQASVPHLLKQMKAQLIQMYTFYNQGLIQSLGLPTARAVSCSVEGEWFVFAKSQFPMPLAKVDFKTIAPEFLDSIAKDIHHHLLIEKKYRVEIIGAFQIAGSRCVVDPLQPLPQFFKYTDNEIEKRHDHILASLKAYPRLYNRLLELLQESQNEISEHQCRLQVLKQLGRGLGPRDLCRAHLLRMSEGLDHHANVSFEELQAYAALFLGFLKEGTDKKLYDQRFREFIITSHEEAEKKLHNRMLVYLIQHIPDTQDWDEIVKFIQIEAVKLLKAVTTDIHAKHNLNLIAADQWTNFESMFMIQFGEAFLQKLQNSLNALVEKIEKNNFTEDCLSLLASDVNTVEISENKSNLNRKLIDVLHDSMQEKAKVSFVHSMQKHLKN